MLCFGGIFYCTVQYLGNETVQRQRNRPVYTVVEGFDYCFTNDLFINWFILRCRHDVVLVAGTITKFRGHKLSQSGQGSFTHVLIHFGR